MTGPSPERFDYGLIREPFHTLIEATGNKLDREFPEAISSHPGSRLVVLGLYRSAQNSFEAIRGLLADTPRDGEAFLRNAPAVAPLVRVLADALSTVVFLFQKLPQHTAWYYKAGYRDLALQLRHLENAHANDSSWAEYLGELRAHTSEAAKLYDIGPREIADPKLIPKWPNAGAIKSHRAIKGERKAFLEYLYDWQYRVLSQDAHLNLIGVVRRLPLYGRSYSPGERLAQLEQLRTTHISTSVSLFIALVTEIELECRFGLLERAKYVWTVASEWDSDTKDLYQRFYLPVLARTGS